MQIQNHSTAAWKDCFRIKRTFCDRNTWVIRISELSKSKFISFLVKESKKIFCAKGAPNKNANLSLCINKNNVNCLKIYLFTIFFSKKKNFFFLFVWFEVLLGGGKKIEKKKFLPKDAKKSKKKGNIFFNGSRIFLDQQTREWIQLWWFLIQFLFFFLNLRFED